MLNIRDALKLYGLLNEFVPEYTVDEDLLEFAGTIIHSIKNSDKPEVFGQSLLLLYPKTTAEELSKEKPLDIIEMFMEGLVDNKFLLLFDFCESLGYGR